MAAIGGDVSGKSQFDCFAARQNIAVIERERDQRFVDIAQIARIPERRSSRFQRFERCATQFRSPCLDDAFPSRRQHVDAFFVPNGIDRNMRRGGARHAYGIIGLAQLALFCRRIGEQ